MEMIDASIEHSKDAQENSQMGIEPKGLTSRDFNLKTAELIKSQIGEVEDVRRSLGLSQRKMCQLLLIDPSTWSRWATGKTEPPPYVYRMLQWGLAVMERYPETHPLANYEKFEQFKKSEELSKRLDELENNLDAKPKEKTGFWSWISAK